MDARSHNGAARAAREAEMQGRGRARPRAAALSTKSPRARPPPGTATLCTLLHRGRYNRGFLRAPRHGVAYCILYSQPRNEGVGFILSFSMADSVFVADPCCSHTPWRAAGRTRKLRTNTTNTELRSARRSSSCCSTFVLRRTRRGLAPAAPARPLATGDSRGSPW